MADEKITALSAAAAVAGTEPLAIVQSGTTKKATLAQILTYIDANYTAAAVASAATVRTNLGLAIGTNVQAYDAELAAIAGLTSAADKLPYFTGSGTAGVADFTAAGRALVDDADASAQRTTLGLGTMATQAASAVAITGGSAASIALSELKQTVAAVNPTTTIDLSLGHVVNLTQDVNTTIAFSNVPTTGKAVTITIVRVKDATGTSRTITWPAAFKWASGAVPTLTQTTGCIDIVTAVTYDGGTTYYCTFAPAFA